MILAMNDGLKIFLIVLAVAIVIALIAFSIYRFLRPKMKVDDKPKDEDIVKEEMNRVLKPIEDEETAKAVDEYKEEDE